MAIRIRKANGVQYITTTITDDVTKGRPIMAKGDSNVYKYKGAGYSFYYRIFW